MDALDKTMDNALQQRVQALHANDDESGNGSIDLADLKLQLDRVEAQLELQDQQNRTLLRGQRLRLWLTIALAAVLCVAMVFLWRQVNAAYSEILVSTGQVNALAGRLQESIDTLDSEELDAMMQNLPEISEKLSSLDVDSLNKVLEGLPSLIDAVAELQQRVQSIQDWFGNLGNLGGLLTGGR